MFSRLLLVLVAGWFATETVVAQTRQPARRKAARQSLKVGQLAPLFQLHPLDSKTAERKTDQVFSLKTFHGKKPVLLIFGSYT